MFQNVQVSLQTRNESFTLGLAQGDDHNSMVGSLSGILLAGQDYEFGYDFVLGNFSSASTAAATASGSISLSFTSVPEPSTGLLFGLGLLSVLRLDALQRRRSRVLASSVLPVHPAPSPAPVRPSQAS